MFQAHRAQYSSARPPLRRSCRSWRSDRSGRRVAQALSDPPYVAFQIEGPVAPVRPIAFAVIVGRRLLDDTRAVRARVGAMRLGIVDEKHDGLGAGAVEGLGAAHRSLPEPLRVRAFLADHDQALAIGQLAVFYPAVVALDFESDCEAEGVAQPIDGGRRVPIEDAAGEPRPVAGGGFHAGLRRVED